MAETTVAKSSCVGDPASGQSKMSYSVPINLIVILSFFIFVFYLFGVHNILTNLGENDCEMTYMFEFPQFVEISLPPSIQQAYPRYALYGYSEGGHTEKLRKMKFGGIPVLFIPGNGGSYKQGRSLASVSLRKALNSRTPFYFDYFMVDFNEDQSAVYGGTLEDQARFVRHCIKKILSFYSEEYRNTQNSVILIGHSLGGLIAKSVFTDEDFRKESVQLIIGLAAPLKFPVLQLDQYITKFYRSIDEAWKNDTRTRNATLVSVGGGIRDILVRSVLTGDSMSDVNALTTAVPGVWCSTDHLSIVWCKQFVLTVIRALFDCVDPITKQLIPDHETRVSIFKYHLLRRTAGKRYATNQHSRFASFDREAYWFENMLRQFTVVEHKGPKTNTYIMIRLIQDPKHEVALIETFNLNIKDWIFVCSANSVYNSVRICEHGENLSNMTEIAPIAPSTRLKKKFAYLSLLKLKSLNFTHVIVKVPRMDSFVQINVDVHEENSRVVNQVVPTVYSMSKTTVIEKTSVNSVYYKINLIGFNSIWQAFNLGVETVSCKTAKNSAVVSFITPWTSQHYHFYMNDRTSMSAKLTLPSVKRNLRNETEHPFVRLHLDPSCQYKVTIKPSIITSVSQIVLHYTGLLPAYVVTVLLMTIREQVMHLDKMKCVLFHSALCSAVRRYYCVLGATVLGSKVLGLGFFSYILPKSDFSSMEDLNTHPEVRNILLFGIAIIITYSAGIGCYVGVVVSGKAAHKMALKFIAKTVTGVANWSEWALSFLQQVPILVSAVLVSLSLSTCGALSIALGTIFYFLKICSIYEDYLEEIFHASLKFISEKVKNMTKSKPKEESVAEGASPPAIENKSENEDETQTAEASSEGTGDAEENSAEAAGSGSEATVETTESETSVVESDKSEESAKDETEEIGSLSVIHFHVTLLLLWGMSTLLYAPSLMVWARNYHFSVFLEKDPAIVPSIILSVCGGVLWQSGVPYPCRKLSQVISVILFILSAVSIMYASVSLYRLGYVISAAVIVLTTTQIMGRFSSP